MFEEFLGIPVHPLLVHFAVVFVPLQILAAFAYALVTRVRRSIEWLVVTLAIVAPLATFAAKLSGDAFRRRLIRHGTTDPVLLSKIAQHSNYANTALYASLVLTVFTVLFVVVTRNRMRAARPAGGPGVAVAAMVLTVGMLGAGVVAGYYIARAGDAGAHIVWNGY